MDLMHGRLYVYNNFVVLMEIRAKRLEKRALVEVTAEMHS